MVNYDIHARDLIEQQILSSIINLSAYNTIEKVKNLFINIHGLDNPEYFGSSMNKSVFIAILRCWENEVQADISMVCTFKPRDVIAGNNHLHFEGKKKNDDGSNSLYDLDNDCKYFDNYIIDISMKWLSETNLEKTIFIHKQFILIDYWNNKAKDILYNEWEQRDILVVTKNIIDGHNLLFDKITKTFQKNTEVLTPKERMRLERQRVKNGEVIWVPSGIPPVDIKWKGYWNGEVTIIAGRPSMGKTALMIASAVHSAFNFNKKVAFFSLEMDKTRLMNHIISAKTGISYKAMKEHSTTDQEFEVIEQWYDWFEIESNLKIYDIHECQTLDEILYFIPGNEIVFIDYLQLVKLVKTTKKKDFVREQDVAEISRSFKLAALQHQIPLVIGAQLNRDVDKRPGHIPVLGDLRESGSIEQDADNVYFPVRPSYYDEIANPDAVIPYWQKGNFTMRGAKGRDTGTDNLKFHMDMLTYKFTDGHLHTAPEPEFNVGNMKI